MDFGIDAVPAIIASGTTQYLAEFSPVFVLVGGVVLAFAVADLLIGMMIDIPDAQVRDYANRKRNGDLTFDENMSIAQYNLKNFNEKADELDDFYSRNGRSGASYDLPNIRRVVDLDK